MTTFYDQISDLIYTKQNLEKYIVSIDSLKSKVKGKDMSEEKIHDLIDKNMSDSPLKDLFLHVVKEGKLDNFTETSLMEVLKKLQDTANTARMVDVIISLPLTEDDLEMLAKQIEKKIDGKPIMRVKIDPSILGGIIIKENTHIYDSSLKTHLESYENEWMKQLKKSQKKLD